MRLKAAALSDIGCVRSRNEDSYLLDDDARIYIVADGMGGHAAGHVASRLCVDTIRQVLLTEEDPNVAVSDSELIPGADVLVPERLRYAINRASQRIQEEAEVKPGLHGMGTTVVMVAVDSDILYVAHVGDSRAYAHDGTQLRRITSDHTWVTEQIQAGLLTEDEGESSQFKNLLTRSVGFEHQVDADTDQFPLKSPCRFLLCSDGLTNMVQEDEIATAMTRYENPEQTARTLVDLALERGAPDNVTVLLLYIEV